MSNKTLERPTSDWGVGMVAFIAVLIVNYLSNAIPIGGQTPKEVSDKYSTLFTPDGFTFGIWGVIYLALGVFVIYQAMPAQRKSSIMAKVNRLFILSCIANIVWIFCWHYELITLSLLVMLFLLFILITIYRVLRAVEHPTMLVDKLVVMLPFSLYTGWITVATIANISVLQTAYGWNDLGGIAELDWTLLKLAAVACIAAWVLFKYHDIAYGLVIAWAAFGIMSKQAATPEVVGAATVLAMTVVLLVTYVGIRYLFKRNAP